MKNKTLLLMVLLLIAGCSSGTEPATNSIISSETEGIGDISISHFPDTDSDYKSQITVSPAMDSTETPRTERAELMIPSKEFMELRDEILIEVLGIDSCLPIYRTFASDPDYVELPYGGIFTKLGDYDYRVSLSKLEFGFDLKPASTHRFYYLDKGIELDVVYQGDAPYEVARYLYISNSSSIVFPSGIGIGSKVDDVISVYEQFILQDFYPMLTNEEVIAIGSELNGIYFIIRDGSVHSIYVGTINENSRYSWLIKTNSVGINLYPDWFYPDREYMEAVQPG